MLQDAGENLDTYCNLQQIGGSGVCRNIKKLRRPEEPATDQELHDAALQFVRKVSGYREPSRANREAFEVAVTEIASATRVLFDKLVVSKT